MSLERKGLNTPLLMQGESKEYGGLHEDGEHKIAVLPSIQAERLKEAEDLQQAVLLLTRLLRKKNVPKNVLRFIITGWLIAAITNILARLTDYQNASEIYGNTKVITVPQRSVVCHYLRYGEQSFVGTPVFLRNDQCTSDGILNYLSDYPGCNSAILKLCSVISKMRMNLESTTCYLTLAFGVPVLLLVIELIFMRSGKSGFDCLITPCFERVCTKTTTAEAKLLTHIKTKYDLPNGIGLENLFKEVKQRHRYLNKNLLFKECRFTFATARSSNPILADKIQDTVVQPKTFFQILTCRKPKIQTNHLKKFFDRLGPEAKASICKNIFEFAGLRICSSKLT